MGVVKSMNQLGITAKYEGRVRLCFDVVEKFIPESEVYLYGKYAQYGSACKWLYEQVSGDTCSSMKIIRDYAVDQILKHSKVGILVLVGDNSSYGEMQSLCWQAEDLICTISDNSFPIDIRVLSKSFYRECLERSVEMQRLDRYKKNLREIEWIDK